MCVRVRGRAPTAAPPARCPPQTYRGHQFTVLALALSRDEQTLYSGSWDHTVRVWRTADKARPRRRPRSLARLSGRKWKPERRAPILQECLSTLGESSGSSEAVWALALSKDSSVLFSASGDCSIRCWRVRQVCAGALLTRPCPPVASSPANRHAPPRACLQVMPCGVAGLGDAYKAFLGLIPWMGGGMGICARRIDYTGR